MEGDDSLPFVQALSFGLFLGLPSVGLVAMSGFFNVQAAASIELAAIGAAATLGSVGVPLAYGPLRRHSWALAQLALLMWSGCAAYTVMAAYGRTHNEIEALFLGLAAPLGVAITGAAIDAVLRPYFDRRRIELRQERAIELARWKAQIETIDAITLPVEPASEIAKADSVAEWADVYVSQDASSKFEVKDAHHAYSAWAALNGHQSLSVSEFGKDFKEWVAANGGDHNRSNGQTFISGMRLEVSDVQPPLLGAPE